MIKYRCYNFWRSVLGIEKGLKSNIETEWTCETLLVCILNTSFLPSKPHLTFSFQTNHSAWHNGGNSVVWSTVYSFKFPTNYVSCLEICKTLGISHTKVIHSGLQTTSEQLVESLALSCNQIQWWFVMCVKTGSAIWGCSRPTSPFHEPDVYRSLLLP